MSSTTGGADTHIVVDQPHAKLFTVGRQELLSRYTNGTGTRKNAKRRFNRLVSDLSAFRAELAQKESSR